jgi:hypothetical protein
MQEWTGVVETQLPVKNQRCEDHQVLWPLFGTHGLEKRDNDVITSP